MDIDGKGAWGMSYKAGTIFTSHIAHAELESAVRHHTSRCDKAIKYIVVAEYFNLSLTIQFILFSIFFLHIRKIISRCVICHTRQLFYHLYSSRQLVRLFNTAAAGLMGNGTILPMVSLFQILGLIILIRIISVTTMMDLMCNVIYGK